MGTPRRSSEDTDARWLKRTDYQLLAVFDAYDEGFRRDSPVKNPANCAMRMRGIRPSLSQKGWRAVAGSGVIPAQTRNRADAAHALQGVYGLSTD